jgi:hypothetical protein
MRRALLSHATRWRIFGMTANRKNLGVENYQKWPAAQAQWQWKYPTGAAMYTAGSTGTCSKRSQNALLHWSMMGWS